MGTTTSVEIRFLASQRESPAGDPRAPEGVVRLPDATLRPFSGWIDLVGALEHAQDSALHRAASPGYSALVRHATHTSFQDWPMLPMWRWSPARRALAGVVGPRVWRAVTQAVRAFLDAHARGRAVDVAGRLAADPELRVGSPESLFTQAPTRRRT
jgi:hypothetical protein